MAKWKLVRTIRREDGPDVEVYRRCRAKGRKKKGTPQLRMAERAVDQLARAGQSLTTTYGARHRAANRKKKDGWLRDLNDNVYRAVRSANKQVDVPKALGL